MTLTTALKRHLLAPAVLVLSMPLSGNVFAQEAPDNSASEPVEMEVNLKDVVKFNWGFQGATQGAGTPNQAGLGFFLPMMVSDNGVLFLDVLANANFADFGDYSSIINTEVDGTTLSTSTRIGYRWLTDDSAWMLGVNGGYDTREMATGSTDNGVPVTNSQEVDFQQVAFGIEAVSDTWNVNVYALVPVDDTEYQLNSVYNGGSLDTYGVDVGYSITPEFETSIGYYYQKGDLGAADGSGVQGRIAYNMGNGFSIGTNLSYDDAFDGRVSADITYRFATPEATKAPVNKAWNAPTIKGLTDAVDNRDVRVHDTCMVLTNKDGQHTCTIANAAYYWYQNSLIREGARFSSNHYDYFASKPWFVNWFYN